MPYINSNNINVFPCANRGGNYDLPSRLTSEYNLTNIINQLLDADSFVITTTLSDQSPISFNIHGYYFNVTDYTIITSLSGLESASDIYASIIVSSSTSAEGNISFQELNVFNSSGTAGGLNLDDSATTTFRGIIFTADDTLSNPSQGIYTLHILTKSGSSWVVPAESTVKFITNSNKRSVCIDDGILS